MYIYFCDVISVVVSAENSGLKRRLETARAQSVFIAHGPTTTQLGSTPVEYGDDRLAPVICVNAPLAPMLNADT